MSECAELPFILYPSLGENAAVADVPWYLVRGSRVIPLHDYGMSDGDCSSASDELPSGDEDKVVKPVETYDENVPTDLLRVAAYLQAGDQDCTCVALALLNEFDLSKPSYQYLLTRTGVVDIMVNLLEAGDYECLLGTLNILVRLTDPNVKRFLIDAGVVNDLTIHLSHPLDAIKGLAAKTLALLSLERKCRTTARKCGTMPTLCCMVDVSEIYFNRLTKFTDQKEREIYDKTLNCLRALSAFSKSKKIAETMYHDGVEVILPKLVKSRNYAMRLEAAELVANISQIKGIQIAILENHYIYYFLRNVKVGGEIQIYAFKALYKCGLNPKLRCEMARYKGHELIFNLAFPQETDDSSNSKQKLATHLSTRGLRYGLACLRRMCLHPTALTYVCKELLTDRNAEQNIDSIFRYLRHKDFKVQAMIIGVIAEVLAMCPIPQLFLTWGIMDHLMDVLRNPEYQLSSLIEFNTVTALINFMPVPLCMRVLDDNEIFHHLWELADHRNAFVRSEVFRSVCYLKKYSRHIVSEMLWHSNNGLKSVAASLLSSNLRLASAAASILAAVADNPKVLVLLPRLKILEKLVPLLKTEDTHLKVAALSALISCAGNAQNARILGKHGVIEFCLGVFDDEKDERVIEKSATLARYLTECKINCMIMHSSGAVMKLMNLLGSNNLQTQESAAYCLENIRKLAFEADIAKALGQV